MSDAFLISGPVLLNQDGTYTFADGKPAETTKCVVRLANVDSDPSSPLRRFEWTSVGAHSPEKP